MIFIIHDSCLNVQVSRMSEQARQVRIPGVGTAVQLADGNLRVNYEDGSSLVLRDRADTVEFCPVARGGQWETFSRGCVPARVLDKLSTIPLVLHHIQTLKSGGLGR